MDGDQTPWQIDRTGEITVQDTDDGLVLHLSGDVEDVVVKQLMATSPVDLSRVVAVDVGDVTYIDSTGLSLLARWAQEAAAAGRPAEIRRRTPRFGRVLEVAGLTTLFVYE
ncbi:MAG: STAS domain-containing protein [Blastococcus sp.]|nr:STAS domain-containing protein [Blastococcus sp.]